MERYESLDGCGSTKFVRSSLYECLLELGAHPSTEIACELAQGPRQFGDLLGAVTSLDGESLGKSLRDLDGDGIIHRRVDPGPPLRVLYELTSLGRELEPALRAFRIRYRSGVERSQA